MAAITYNAVDAGAMFREEKIIIKKIAKIKKLHDIIPQFSSIQAFYSLNNEENVIEISIKDVNYSTANEGKYVFLESVKDTGFHDKVWTCRTADDEFSKIYLYESWLEDIKETIVFYDSEGKTHFEIDSDVLKFIEKIRKISGVKHAK